MSQNYKLKHHIVGVFIGRIAGTIIVEGAGDVYILLYWIRKKVYLLRRMFLDRKMYLRSNLYVFIKGNKNKRIY